MTVLFSYDIETAEERAKDFLIKIDNFHTEKNIPYTIFITGECASIYKKELSEIASNRLCCIGQHTNKHIAIKSLFIEPTKCQKVSVNSRVGECKLITSKKLKEIKEDIKAASDIISEIVGYKPKCFCAPYGFYNGLIENEQILEILRENGICCITSDTRNCNGCNPIGEKLPYFYQNFKEILEIPSSKYQDDISYFCFSGNFNQKNYIDEVLLYNQKLSIIKTHDFYIGKEKDFNKEKKEFLEYAINKAKEKYFNFSTYEKIYAEYIKESFFEGR
jgi:peptidoglycan/xylan/chitin deacetylase (PgdA/CDA1 family)